jgi:dTDP-4-dehydrorhamnose reductase
MKIIIIGGTGTVGQAVVKELSQRHEMILVTHQKGDIHVDITNKQSIVAMYQKVGAFDAIISSR